MPDKPVGDKAYDSDKLDNQLLDERGVEMVAPYRRGAKYRKPKTAGIEMLPAQMEGRVPVCMASKIQAVDGKRYFSILVSIIIQIMKDGRIQELEEKIKNEINPNKIHTHQLDWLLETAILSKEIEKPLIETQGLFYSAIQASEIFSSLLLIVKKGERLVGFPFYELYDLVNEFDDVFGDIENYESLLDYITEFARQATAGPHMLLKATCQLFHREKRTTIEFHLAEASNWVFLHSYLSNVFRISFWISSSA